MNNVKELIKERRSVRSFDGRAVDESIKQQLLSYADSIENPFNIPVELKFLEAGRDGLSCPVVIGTDLYVGGKIRCIPSACLAFGYSFENFVLYAQSVGLGTVWLGGTMNRTAFEKAMELGEDEMMPCASPIGYAAKKMSMREIMMRKAVKADERLPFEALFFEGAFDRPLTREAAGSLAQVLEMVRLAPSAVNKQPWRLVVTENAVHFYLKRSMGAAHEGKLDMQMIDMGIALCHFELTARENGMEVEFSRTAPDIQATDMQYIASYRYMTGC